MGGKLGGNGGYPAPFRRTKIGVFIYFLPIFYYLCTINPKR
jgi:hypothetical protein